MTSLTTLTDLDDPDWTGTTGTKNAASTPREWIFCTFLMCMAAAALPLVCIRWTIANAATRAGAIDDALLLALPVAIPLPFLFVGCVGALVFHPASRTPETSASFGAALAIGLAAACALVA